MRNDLIPIGYGHLFNYLVLGLSFLSCTRLWPVLILEPMPWSLWGWPGHGSGSSKIHRGSSPYKFKALRSACSMNWDHNYSTKLLLHRSTQVSRHSVLLLIEASFNSHLCAGSIWWAKNLSSGVDQHIIHTYKYLQPCQNQMLLRWCWNYSVTRHRSVCPLLRPLQGM